MGRRDRENEVSELLSLGISGTEIARMNNNELEDMVDDIKQTMIREFRAAYNSTEYKEELESVSSI